MEFNIGDVVKHYDAAYSENFTIVEACHDADGCEYMIQGTKPKYSEPFPVSKEKLFKITS